jgi:hypothetical protein
VNFRKAIEIFLEVCWKSSAQERSLQRRSKERRRGRIKWEIFATSRAAKWVDDDEEDFEQELLKREEEKQVLFEQ